MNFSGNSNLNNQPSITVTHTHNNIHSIGGISLSNTTTNDNSTHITHQHPKPAKIARRNPSSQSRATRPIPDTVPRHSIPAPGMGQANAINYNGGNHGFSGTAPARAVVPAQGTAPPVANGANPRSFPASNTYRLVGIVTPDQTVNQNPNHPLLPIHVYQQAAYRKVSRPFRLTTSSAQVHHLEAISSHLSNPLLHRIKRKENSGIPLYVGVDPTSNTNFIISTRK